MKHIKPIMMLYDSYINLKRRVNSRPRSLEKIHEYWRNPDKGNMPSAYFKGEERSLFLRDIITPYTGRNDHILEIGCNVGRNMNCLFQAGYWNLAGVEINDRAVMWLKQHYREMGDCSNIYVSSIEDIIEQFPGNNFNAVFTMATLEHIHPDSEWVFKEIARITGDYLITVEDELGYPHWRRFPRNYRKIFETLGMTQVEEKDCGEVSGLSSNFIARVFKWKK